MPALFVFALTSERKLFHRMEEVAEETEHAIKSVEWADRHHRKHSLPAASADEQEKQKELRDLYRKAVLNSGVRVVEEDHLSMPHQAANFVQANPLKVILSIGVPAVAYIFYGRSGKEHCKFSKSIFVFESRGTEKICIAFLMLFFSWFG